MLSIEKKKYLSISLFNPKMDKKERSKTCRLSIEKKKKQRLHFYIIWMQSHSWIF